MRFLFLSHVVSQTAKGGGERYAREVGASLRALDARVHLATIPDALAQRVDLAAFDVVHVASSGKGVRSLLSKAGTARKIVTFHGSPLGLARHGWSTGRGGVYRLGQLAVYGQELLWSARLMKAMDGIVAVSECTARDLARQYAPAARKTLVSDGGVDTSKFTAEGARDDGYVLFVGRLERSKGVDTLVRALSGTAHRLVIAGDGSLARELRTLAGPNVEFEGEVSDERLLELYRGASACVFPSLYEGYGLVALEALACGTPTAVSDAFCVRGPAASLLQWFPVGDAARMREAVAALSGVKTPAWSARAYQTVRDHHDTRVRARELLAFYERLAPSARP